MTEHNNHSPDNKQTADLPSLFISPYFQEQYNDLIRANLYLQEQSGLGDEVGAMFDDMEADLLFDAISQIEELIKAGKATPITKYLSMIQEGNDDQDDTYNPDHFMVVTLSTAHVVVVQQRPDDKDVNGRDIYRLHLIFLNKTEFMRSLLSVPPSSP